VAYAASIQPGVFARHHRELRPDAGGIRRAPALADLTALHCVANAQGWFYGGTPEAAAHLADDASALPPTSRAISAGLRHPLR